MISSKRSVRDMTTAEILFRLVTKQSAYYHGILELTQQEGELLEKERPLTEVTPLLKKKGILLACVEEIDAALSPIKHRWVSQKREKTDPYSERAHAALEKLNDCIKNILDQDERNQKQFQSAMARMRSKSVES